MIVKDSGFIYCKFSFERKEKCRLSRPARLLSNVTDRYLLLKPCHRCQGNAS